MCRHLKGGLFVQKLMLPQKVCYDATPRSDGVMGIIDVKIFTTAAEIRFATFVVGLCFRVVNDASKQLKCAFNFRMVERSLLPKNSIVQMDDGLADFLIGRFVTGHD